MVLAAGQRRVARAARRGRSSPWPTMPWNLQPLDALDQVVGELARLDELEERAARVEGAHDDRRENSVPSSGRRRCAAVLGDHAVDRRSSRISAPNDSAARASTWVKPPLPPLWNAHEPRLAVVLAHLVEEQHQPGAGRHRADLRADDARGGVVALDGSCSK